jgi:hypothetical protein
MAKRTSLLSDEEALKFFNCNGVRDRYRQNFFHAFRLAKEQNPTMTTLRIHGEIFGGTYPHKEVPRKHV